MAPFERVLILLTFFLLALAWAVPALAETPQQQKDNPCTATVESGQDLQNAMDRLPQGQPVTLCLDQGEFTVNAMVSIHRNDITLHGQGTATILRMAQNVQQPVLVIGDNQHQQPSWAIANVTIENLRIVGSGGEHEFMPERPYLSNSGVVVRAGQNIRLSGLQVRTCRSACLLSEYNTRGITIENSDISGATWDGVSFNRTTQVKLINNVIHDNIAAGLTTEHLEDSQIRDNRFEHNGSQGIYLSDARGNQFVNNLFDGNHSAGVFLACAIRYRSPEILCWDNSMSQNNVFENNHFINNPFTYTVGVDRAANCAGPDFKPNLWRNNQADAAGVDIEPQRYGHCMREE